jgi:hypothetical protein
LRTALLAVLPMFARPFAYASKIKILERLKVLDLSKSYKLQK